MADFSTSAELELEVPNRTLRDARSKIERELGEIEVGVSAGGGGGGRQQGQLAGILDANRQQFELAVERNEYLEELVDELEEVGGGGFLSGLSGMGRVGGSAGGSALGGFAGSVGGGALAGAVGGASLATAGAVTITVATALLTVEGLRNPDALTRQRSDEAAREVTEAGQRGQLPGSRFDENAPEPINLGEEIGDFSWPEVTTDDVLGPVDDSIEELIFPGPLTKDDVLSPLRDQIDPPPFEMPTPSNIADAIAEWATGGGNQQDTGVGGNETRPSNPPRDTDRNWQVDNRTEINVDATDTEQVKREVERERKRDMERLERKIRRATQ